MSGRSERIRDEIIDSGSPLRGHSMSHRIISYLLAGERKFLGKSNDKARKAQARRTRHDAFLQSLPGFQFARSLGRLMEGKGTDVDEFYVMDNISKYERPLSSDNGCITVVDLTPMSRVEKPRIRINLLLSPALDNELGRLAEELNTKKTKLTRTLLGVGLELYEAAIKPNGGVYFQEQGEEPQKVLPII